jgi:amidase
MPTSSGFPEYARHDGLGLAELVAKGEVTASELVEEAIARIERHDPTLNAVVHRMYDKARATASEQPEPGRGGPFQGVPLVVKDILGDCEGEPTTSGSRFLKGNIAAQDSELVARYRRAGLIPLCKTNAPEFGLMPTTEPLAYGPTRNPWNLEHSTGGSSGGSAACVAAGIVPIGHANDGGGSIRIPASCCGLVGLKPTRGRNPLGPLIGDLMGGLVAEHVVTRTVRDSAAVLDCTAGPDVGDPYWAPPPERSFLSEVGRDPGELRVAFWSEPFGVESLTPECAQAAREAASLLADLGHRVEEAQPAIDVEAQSQAFITIWAAGCAFTVDAAAQARGVEPTADDIEPLSWAFYQLGQTVSASAYQLAVAALQGISRQVAHFLEDYDVWVTPTLGKPPLRIGELDANADVQQAMQPLLNYVPYTPLFNVTGQPAISLPLHQTQTGLPVGVHFAARFGGEGLLLRLAAQIEEAEPWIDRKPPIWD